MALKKLLIADDDQLLRTNLVKYFGESGFDVVEAADGPQALNALRAEPPPDVALIDLKMPDDQGDQEPSEGLRVIQRAIEAGVKACAYVLITAYGDSNDWAEVGRLNISVVTKPAANETCLRKVNEALGERESKELAKTLEVSGLILGRSEPMIELGKQIGRLAKSNRPVLIQGESGTGKELVAAALHGRSGRASAPYIPWSCAVLTEEMAASQLYGIERGVATGVAGRPGLFEIAKGGTVFLDEIQALTAGLQSKLLRAIDPGRIGRVGSVNETAIDVRIIAATSCNKAVEQGRLLEALYNRFVVIEVPTLGQRREDIPLLVQHFRNLNRHQHRIHQDALDKLCDPNVRWPGNVRDLKKVVDTACEKADGRPITVQDLELPERSSVDTTSDQSTDKKTADVKRSLSGVAKSKDLMERLRAVLREGNYENTPFSPKTVNGVFVEIFMPPGLPKTWLAEHRALAKARTGYSDRTSALNAINDGQADLEKHVASLT